MCKPPIQRKNGKTMSAVRSGLAGHRNQTTRCLVSYPRKKTKVAGKKPATPPVMLTCEDKSGYGTGDLPLRMIRPRHSSTHSLIRLS